MRHIDQRLGAGVFGNHAAFRLTPTGQPVHQANEHITLKGFNQIIGRPILNGVHRLGDLGKRRHQHNRHLGPLGFDFSQKRQAAQLGHFNIGQH